MFKHVILYKDSDEYEFIQNESDLRKEIYVIIDDEIAIIDKENSPFRYIFSYKYIDKFNDKMFVITMENKFEKDYSEKIFYNFNFAREYFNNLN